MPSGVSHWSAGGIRDPKKDLVDLLAVLEQAEREGAIDSFRQSGQRLIEASLILRRWWP